MLGLNLVRASLCFGLEDFESEEDFEVDDCVSDES